MAVETFCALLSKINETWGSFDEFSKVFIQGGIGQFGRGWVWLVMKDGGAIHHENIKC